MTQAQVQRGAGWSSRSSNRQQARADLTKLFDRLPPHSEQSEMALLGSMILDPKVIPEVMEVVSSPDDFYSEKHAAIFEALRHTYSFHQSGDLVQLSAALRDMGLLDQVGGEEYLVSLAEGVPSATNWPYYARIVRQCARLRQLIDAGGTIVHNAFHASSLDAAAAQAVLDEALASIFDIAGKMASVESESLEVLLSKTLDMLDAMRRSGRTITGLSTGFHDLDELTSGLQRGEMIVVAARPSMGKTAFGLNLAEQIALGGAPFEQRGPRTPVGLFSMEMTRQSIVQRLLCAYTGVDSHKLRRNTLGNEDFRALNIGVGKLSEAAIIIDDTPALTVSMLEGKARRMVRQHGIGCIIIDYLQLMQAPAAARENRQVEVSAISRGIKALAQNLQIPVVCMAQLNRQAEQREGNRPRMADLRESGSIEQDADVIMLLHREEYYHAHKPDWAEENPDKVGVAEVIIAKQRNGPTGTIHLRWNAASTRFQNLARGYESVSASAEAKPAGREKTRPEPPVRHAADWQEESDENIPI